MVGIFVVIRSCMLDLYVCVCVYIYIYIGIESCDILLTRQLDLLIVYFHFIVHVCAHHMQLTKGINGAGRLSKVVTQRPALHQQWSRLVA